VYLDTAILLKLVVPEPDSSHYAKLVDRQPVWSSHIAFSECFSALLRKEREGALTTAQRARAWQHVEADIAARRIGMVPVTSALLERANAILAVCHPAVALRSLDAIHLASAERAQSWPLCSNDARVRAAAARLGLPLSPLPGTAG
jgi:predicted nucleic acid-binding protein